MCAEVAIDGSQGEGGGQMLRTSLAFSAITGRDLRIKNIRAGRKNPGLARQHLAGLELIADVCQAEMSGAVVGSTEIRFSPGDIHHGQYSVDVGTAGSITLVLQTVLPALATVKGVSEIQLTGGTDVKWSPPADYYSLVLFPLLKKMGMECSLDIMQRGYYPRGGGRAVARIRSTGGLVPLELQKTSEPDTLTGIVNITGLPVKIAERIGSVVLDILPETVVHIQHEENGPGQGVGVVLAATDGKTFLGGSALGERGKPAERVGKEAAGNLLEEIEGRGAVDVYTSDQLLPFLAIAGGSYTTRKLTGHARTNVDVIEEFLGKTIRVQEGETVTFSKKMII